MRRRLVREAMSAGLMGNDSVGRAESDKSIRTPMATKRTVPASRDFVFGIGYCEENEFD